MEYECKDGVCYLKNYKNYKCPNNIICGNENSNSVLIKDGLCIECTNLFPSWRNKDSILQIVEKYEKCPLCLRDEQLCVYRPEKNCSHFLCEDCFKKKYFGIELKKPVFPNHDKSEELYFSNIKDEIDEEWMHNKDIINYIKKLDIWNDFQEKHILITTKCFECFE